MGKASLAQSAERWTFNPTAAGSNPAGGFPFFDLFLKCVEIGHKMVYTASYPLKLILSFFFLLNTINYTTLLDPSIIRQRKVVPIG